MSQIKLQSISIYPIKSLAGYDCNTALVEKQGLKDDRLTMLVDEKGVFITQRAYPQLALLKAQFKEQQLIVKAQNGDPIMIDQEAFKASEQAFSIWQDRVMGRVADKTTNQFFSDYLNKKVRLIQYDKQQPRATDVIYSKADDIVSFADGFPLLLLNQASLDDLNQKLETPVTIQNFRGNLIIEGAKAYAEDHWKKIRIGNIEFDMVKPCSRCVMTTNDPQKGILSASKEPLKTLAKYRNFPKGIMFGVNLIPRSFGEIKKGGKLEVIG